MIDELLADSPHVEHKILSKIIDLQLQINEINEIIEELKVERDNLLSKVKLIIPNKMKLLP